MRRLRLSRPLAMGLFGPMLAAIPASAMAAPVATERIRSTQSTPGWTGSTDLGFGLRRGNIDKLDASTTSGIQWQNLHPRGEGWGELTPPPQAPAFFQHRWLLLARLNLTRVSSANIVNSGFAHTRYTYMVIPRLGPEVFLQAQYNEFTLLKSRMLGGAGARVAAVNREHISVWGGTGYMAEFEVNDVVPGDPHPARVVNHRWTSYAAVLTTFADHKLLLQNTAYVQPRFDDPTDLRVLDTLQFQGNVTEVFSMGAELEVQYDSRPPQTVESLDLTLTSFFRIKFI